MKGARQNCRDEPDGLNETRSDQRSLEEGVDYYIEDGLVVFTADFLKRRGYCCENNCRHCPYRHSCDHDS